MIKNQFVIQIIWDRDLEIDIMTIISWPVHRSVSIYEICNKLNVIESLNLGCSLKKLTIELRISQKTFHVNKQVVKYQFEELIEYCSMQNWTWYRENKSILCIEMESQNWSQNFAMIVYYWWFSRRSQKEFPETVSKKCALINWLFLSAPRWS